MVLQARQINSLTAYHFFTKTGLPFTLSPPLAKAAKIFFTDVFLLLKVTLTVFSLGISCLITPSVVERIEPIFLLRPQEAHPGIFSCTILSAA